MNKGTATFSGELMRGEGFEKTLGNNILFRLVPAEYGWEIWAGTSAEPGNNFCEAVTPPFRGGSEVRVEGWHFRNSDNTAPDDPEEEEKNFSAGTREFLFLLTKKDYDRACGLLDKVLWPYNFPDEAVAEAVEEIEKLGTGKGRLTIEEMRPGNLIQGEQAWIDFMRFSVEIAMPEEQEVSSSVLACQSLISAGRKRCCLP